MNGITKEQIEQARQVGILTYMRAYEPQELVKVGRNEYTTRTHDSLRISENGKWNWCSQGFGGTNALNYLVHVKGLSFVSAVQQLCEGLPVPAASAQGAWERPPNSLLPIPFSAPPRDQNNVSVLRYLRGRGIRNPVLNFCIEQGLLYQTDHKGYKNCVFLGKDAENEPRYACVRGCSGGWRGDVAGSQKQFAFRISARDPDVSRVEVYEAPIDALSGASLRVLAGRDWRTVHYLALGGLNYMALDQFLADHPQVKTLQLCLDNDQRGRAFAKKLADLYGEHGYTVKDLPPPKGKDYNDYLQLRLGLKQEHEPER